MVFDSVQMDSHTVQRRSFTSFSATDEMNNKWISALMGAGGVGGKEKKKKKELIETGSSGVGFELRRCKQVLCLRHALTEGPLPSWNIFLTSSTVRVISLPSIQTLHAWLVEGREEINRHHYHASQSRCNGYARGRFACRCVHAGLCLCVYVCVCVAV